MTTFKKCRGIHRGKKLGSSQDFFPMNTLHFLNIVILHLSAYEDGTECSETSAYKIQTPENYPEESIQHSEQGESLKSRTDDMFSVITKVA
jgi:hypothetical protein